MRISENMKIHFLLSDLTRTMSRIMDTQQDVATAKRIHQPSDDPDGTARLLRLKGMQSRIERYLENVEHGSRWLTVTDSALNHVTNIVSEVDAVLLQASNDSLGAQERETLAKQVAQLWAQIMNTANQTEDGRYIFGGTNNDTAPYTVSNSIDDETFTSVYDTAVDLDHTGLITTSVVVTSLDGLTVYTEGVDYTIDDKSGSITVLGTGSMADGADYLISYETEAALAHTLNPEGVDGVITRRIDEDNVLQINVAATDVFGDSDGLLVRLKEAYNALMRNDRDAIIDARNALATDLDIIRQIQGEVGTKIGRLELQGDKLETDLFNADKLISSIEDTDMAAAIIELQKDQTMYEAALKTGSQIVQMTLLDYL
jgi:flagellar hook-associated protein 3 FlgL